MDKSFPLPSDSSKDTTDSKSSGQALTGWGSVAVHSGHKQDPTYAHLVPIYASSTFVYDEAEQGMRRFSGKEQGYIYSRWGNPTFAEAENKIAALETFGIEYNGSPVQAKGILHASGMAAITTLMLVTLKPGDKILTHFSLYGGTEELITKVLPPLGISAIIADLRTALQRFRRRPYRVSQPPYGEPAAP